MKKYIVSKKHKTVNSFGASVVTATILLSAPMILNAESTILQNIDVVEKSEKIDYSESYKVDKSSSSKVVQDLVDTPQTIQVITKKVMDEQKATTLQEALRNTPGVTLLLGEGGNTNSKNNINLRGFDVSSSIYKDGIRDLSAATRDMFNTEAVEVTKGTVGADNGRSVASGYINQVTKTATNKDQNEVAASYGTEKNSRLTADLNKALSETSGIRLNVMKQDGEVAGRDEIELDRIGIAASVAFGIGTDTRTSFGYERYEQDDVPDGGVSVVGLDGYSNSVLSNAGIKAKKVDPSNFYGTPDDYEKVTTDTFTAKFEHDFSDKTTLTNTTRYGKSKIDSLLTSIGNATITNVNNPSSWTISRSGQARWQENEILTNATNITTSAQTGSVVHNISTGFDFTIDNQTSKTKVTTGSTYPAANLYNPDYSQRASNLTVSETGAKTFGETRTIGVYAFDSISLTDKIILTGGGRVDKYNTKTDITTIATATNPGGGVPVGTQVANNLEDSGTLKSYKVGAVYKPLDNGSVYISYADSQLPPGGANFTLSSSATNGANPSMDPQQSATLELGTKWDFLDNKLAISTAIYKTTNENELINLGDSSNPDYQQVGEREVKGIEFNIAGQITDDWSLTAGIAKSESEIIKGTTNQGAVLTYTPEWTATIWSSYNITKAITAGAGARYVGEMFAGKASTTALQNNPNVNGTVYEADSYIVYDAMMSYKINKNLLTQLNVYNLTDEEYVQNINNNGNRYTPGSARSALLSLAYKF
ncbi:MAG: catecholate siderophore receptor Fiu [Aliarcobacter sp.]|nr:catecholate siderophore receptor Fiu [Aliarcobacter sp.]